MPNFDNISKISKLKQRFADALHNEGYDFKDPNVLITHYRQKIIVICAGYNFTKTQHDYETYFDNFIDRGRRCKYCHSARPEDFAEAFADKIKDVSLTIGKSKRDKYFAYTCVICNSKYSDTVSNMKKILCDNPTRKICKKKRCVKKGKRIKELTLAMSQLYN